MTSLFCFIMAGIYLHIPFCKQRCTYCDFHFSTNTSYTGQMISALCKEIELRANELQGQKIETIYFGGGTPSIIEIPLLKDIFERLHQHFDLSNVQEITLEANPDDITTEKVKAWKQFGINRLSIGVQSFYDEDLEWMNRAHCANQSLESIQIAQDNGITNLTIDLIYGLPNLSLERWKSQLIKAIDLGVQHLSCYCLTVEKKTALYKKVQDGILTPANQDLQNEQYDELINYTKSKGFVHYEISNFGLPDFIAIHNSNYWKGKPYLGIGPSAHSFIDNIRSWNIRSNHIYMDQLSKGILPNEREILSAKDLFNEKLLIGLRTMWGVDLNELQQLHILSEEFHQTLHDFIQKKWIILNGQQIMLSEIGQRFADAIASDLFEV